MRMIRTNYYYPQEMLKALKAKSKKTGVPMAELVRRFIHKGLWGTK